MRRLLMICIFGLVLVGCAPDPRNQADADATRLQAEQDAADQAQARAQQALQFDQDQAERRQVSAQWVASWTGFIRWVMVAATLAAGLAVLGAGAGMELALVGNGLAAARGAGLRANLIYLDKSTGQFPLLNYEGRGMVSLTDPNTGQTLLCDTRNQADRQMIAASGAVRLSGVVSHNAASHRTDPAGVALVGTNPVAIFDAQEDEHDN